jgi:hypothetical protein
MAKRIEQSRGHSHPDLRVSDPVHAVSAIPLPLTAPEEPTNTRPTLKLVGGTDLMALDSLASPRT